MASQLFIYSTRPSPSRHLARSKHGKQIAFTFVVYLFAQRHKSMCPIKVSKVPIGAVWINCFKRKKKRARNYRVEKKSFFIKRTSSGGKKFSSLLASGISFNEISVLRNMLWSMREKVDEHSKWPKLFCCPWAETSSLEVFNSLRYSMALVGEVLKLR